MATKTTKLAPKPPTMRALREQLAYSETELALQESRYMTSLFKDLTIHEQRFSEAQAALADPDEDRWVPVSSGGNLVDNKTMSETMRDPLIMRRQAYRYWRTNPHARSILRNFQRFIIGREFGFDFADEHYGTWNEDKTKLVEDESVDAPLMIRELWNDFTEKNRFIQRAKELVLRTFRDGECFIRKFESKGRVQLRFIEPSAVMNPTGSRTEHAAELEDFDEDDPNRSENAGKKTLIKDGIEVLADDVETVVAYHVKTGTSKTERVPMKDVIHSKPLADSNDMRGICLLEVIAKQLTNYAQWEDYRMILNKMRTAIAMIRKVEGTANQAAAIIAARQSPRLQPKGREPQTTSGRREAMFEAGTILTPGVGVTYDFLSPKLEARDASEDGRRFQLTMSAGVGLPEMLVTGDWSNSNYASSVEGRTPAVREWEDWQDFFEPVFKRILKWVVDAAKRGLSAPQAMTNEATIQWPSLITKDAVKETERNTALSAGGILSHTTWAAREDLVYEEELDNMRREAELRGDLESQLDDGDDDEPDEDDEGRPVKPPASQEGQLDVALESLKRLQEQVDSTTLDQAMKTSMGHYLKVASKLVGVAKRRSKRGGKSWRAGRA